MHPSPACQHASSFPKAPVSDLVVIRRLGGVEPRVDQVSWQGRPLLRCVRGAADMRVEKYGV